MAIEGQQLNAENKSSKSRLPSTPKVDLASSVTFDSKEVAIFGIEMQVANKHNPSISVRIDDYGEHLSRLKLASDPAKFQAKKVYETALCLWDSDDNQLGVIWGRPRGCFTSAKQEARVGVEYPKIDFPVCCTQVFLGKMEWYPQQMK